MVLLTTKGLQVMNAVPSPLRRDCRYRVAESHRDELGAFELYKIGDLIGGVIGGSTKSIGSG
jgi:hypothetical protein